MPQAKPLAVILLILLSISLILSGCGGGRGGGGGGGDLTQSVRVTGTVDDGTPTSPIANAGCRFEQTGSTSPPITTTANAAGQFSLQLSLDVEGFFLRTPPAFPKLTISTFLSTVGQTAETLVQQGYLLAEDVPPVMAQAAQRYDRFQRWAPAANV